MVQSKRGNAPAPGARQRTVERVQTGVRIERRILLVLKALAAEKGLSVGDLLEGIVLHAFEGTPPFGAETRATVEQLRAVYGLDLEAADSHLLVDRAPARAKSAAAAKKRPRA